MIPVNIAIEDELSEATLRQIFNHLQRGFWVGFAYRRGGFGYLRKTVRGWNLAAKGRPFVILTDLDQYACPQKLIDEWLPVPKHPNLLFRIAVREVESWLLADRNNIARFFGISVQRVPTNVDQLTDAKSVLVDLARKARSGDLRKAIVPKLGSTAKQGPDYNGCLVPFIRDMWDIEAAATNSPSLARTVERLRTFEPIWPADNSCS